MNRLTARIATAWCVFALGCSGDGASVVPDDAAGDAFDVVVDEAPAVDARVTHDAADGGRDVVDVPDDDGVAPYTEALCNDTASLDDLAAAWTDSPVGLRDAVRGLVARRYPMSAALLGAQDDAVLAQWFRPARTFQDVLRAFDVGVRESGRAWDAAMSGTVQVYRLRDDLVIAVRPVEGFARREILTLHANPGVDPYANAYLLGPDGAQGLESVLEDLVHDTHALAARYCTREAVAAGTRVDARDAVLTMMYYLELYLMRARTSHPAMYAAIVADAAYRQLLRAAWQRADFWLDATARAPELGVRDGEIAVWTFAPANLLEMFRLPE
jgi:hypothetical protein